MRIIKITVTAFEQNCRLLIDTDSRTCIIVDPGGEVDRILSIVNSEHLSILGIFITHSHLDHAGGVSRLLESLSKGSQANNPVTVFAHPLEKSFRANIREQSLMFGLSDEGFENCPEPQVLLKEGTEIRLGALSGQVLESPGHSPGHVVLSFPASDEPLTLEYKGKIMVSYDRSPPVLIAGDVLFRGSIGRTDLPGGNMQTLLASIKNKILTLPGETLVLSGHGPDTTIAEEARSNPFLSEL